MFSHLCNKTADIARKTTAAASSSNRGHSDTYATVYDDIAVALQPKDGRAVEAFARRNIQTDYTAYTDTELSLRTGDRLVCDSVTYTVQSWGDMAGRGRGWQIHLLRRQ
jgi:hypothetical protein